MTEVQRLAAFVQRASYDAISEEAREQLRLRLLDSLGTAIGALEGEPIRAIRKHVDEFGRAGLVTLIGGGSSAPDLAAFYNGALVRYLDFNDSYLAPGETCHPSDNLAPVLAACEHAGADGRSLLSSLAVAYQVHARLSDEAPVRHRGFDHTTQGAYAVAAGVARALELEAERIADAVAISGTCNVALRVTRTGALSNWKGLAYPNTAFVGTHAAYLAARGITGPAEVFEGNKGFRDSIAGDFTIDWENEDLERVTRTIIKKFNAEIHSQATIEGVLELRAQLTEEGGTPDPEGIEAIEVETFDVAFDIIGGGEEGEKTTVRTKEEADHSLPYMVAVALLDGRLDTAQYEPSRIGADDVQGLLRRVEVRPDPELSRRFPDEMPCRISIRADGSSVSVDKSDYEGFHTRPMGRDAVEAKFRKLSARFCGRELQDDLVAAALAIDGLRVAELTALLKRVGD